jgi:hypothetical protein
VLQTRWAPWGMRLMAISQAPSPRRGIGAYERRQEYPPACPPLGSPETEWREWDRACKTFYETRKFWNKCGMMPGPSHRRALELFRPGFGNHFPLCSFKEGHDHEHSWEHYIVDDVLNDLQKAWAQLRADIITAHDLFDFLRITPPSVSLRIYGLSPAAFDREFADAGRVY